MMYKLEKEIFVLGLTNDLSKRLKGRILTHNPKISAK